MGVWISVADAAVDSVVLAPVAVLLAVASIGGVFLKFLALAVVLVS